MQNIARSLFLVVMSLLVALPAGSQGKKLRIVTTLNYLRAITEEIAGDHAEVTALANPKQDPHYVTPTPRMNQLARDADLFIENGLSLDLWSKNVIDASGNPGIQVGSPGHLTATINTPVKELPTEVSRSWGDIHPQGNPHIWLDPFNVKIIAGNIAEKLKQIDPDNGAYYTARLEELRNRLDREMFGEQLLRAVGKSAGDILTRKAKNNELDQWLASKHLTDKLGGWLKKAEQIRGMKVITYHKTYIYFADRFGLQLAGELEEKPGIPPPPQHRDEIVELMKRDHIRIILNDNFYSREAADYIASRTGANVILTYIDVGSADDVRTYEQLITKLLDQIITASR
ncbi:MAG TPA: metal ABC transporter substrate-binding protein [Bacteroidota bacterium]|nr:metal ABC transporter substrate-binding protein [Bacteroidota bacterium]